VEQDVEVRLASPHGGAGRIVRLVPAAPTLAFTREQRRKKKARKDDDKPPNIVELLRKVEQCRRQLDAGELASQAETACREGITRGRVTQVLALLQLPHSIGAKIPSRPSPSGSREVT